MSELDSGQPPLGWMRHEGGGRERLADLEPGCGPRFLALVEPETRGDRMSPLRWTTKSTRNLARERTAQGHRVSADPVLPTEPLDPIALEDLAERWNLGTPIKRLLDTLAAAGP